MNKMVTDLKLAKNSGSAHEGAGHWWHQRFTAILLIFLVTWFFAISYDILTGEANLDMILSSPMNSGSAIIFVVVMFYHASLGMQVVIEDYVSCLCLRRALIIAMQITSIVTAFAAVFTIYSVFIASFITSMLLG